MLRNTRELLDCAIGATDGLVGEVRDVYFDDRKWTMRFLVVLTGDWLHRRQVLISPECLGRADWGRKLLPASITTAQVRSSPDIDMTKPVSRRHESLLLSHYEQPRYWEEIQPWAGAPVVSGGIPASQADWSQEHFARAVTARDPDQTRSTSDAELHLRSGNAVADYGVRCTDGDIGKIHGLVFAEEDWAIRYLVVETGHWWAGHLVLIAVQWIRAVSWADACVEVDLSRQTLIHAPVFNPAEPLDRHRESELFAYFGRAGYWDEHRQSTEG